MTQPRFYIALKSFGVVNDKGRCIFGIEYSGKRILAEEDAPLALVVAMLEEMCEYHRYSSPEAAEKDFQRLRDFANELQVEKVEHPPATAPGDGSN